MSSYSSKCNFENCSRSTTFTGFYRLCEYHIKKVYSDCLNNYKLSNPIICSNTYCKSNKYHKIENKRYYWMYEDQLSFEFKRGKIIIRDICTGCCQNYVETINNLAKSVRLHKNKNNLLEDHIKFIQNEKKI